MKKAKSRLKQKEQNKLLPLTVCAGIITIELWLSVFRYLGEFKQTEIIQAYKKPTISQAKEVIDEVIYTPSKKTRDLIEKHSSIAGKLKNEFGADWVYVAELVANESSFNHKAINPSSGACGLGQSLPCSKMGVELDDIDGQIAWINEYITRRYGSAKQALDFWKLNNWY